MMIDMKMMIIFSIKMVCYLSPQKLQTSKKKKQMDGKMLTVLGFFFFLEKSCFHESFSQTHSPPSSISGSVSDHPLHLGEQPQHTQEISFEREKPTDEEPFNLSYWWLIGFFIRYPSLRLRSMDTVSSLINIIWSGTSKPSRSVMIRLWKSILIILSWASLTHISSRSTIPILNLSLSHHPHAFFGWFCFAWCYLLLSLPLSKRLVHHPFGFMYNSCIAFFFFF